MVEFEVTHIDQDKYPTIDLMKMLHDEMIRRMKESRVDETSLYVCYGAALNPEEIDMRTVAGKINGMPFKNADGKWVADVTMCDSLAGRAMKDAMKSLLAAGVPMKIYVASVTDSHKITGPWHMWFAPHRRYVVEAMAAKSI